MKKRVFSATAGLLLLAGTGAASASPLISVGADGVAGWLSFDNFLGPTNAACGGAMCMTLADLTNSAGTGPADLTWTGQEERGPLSLFNPDLDLKFYYSPDEETGALGPDVVKMQVSWNNAVASVPAAPLEVDDVISINFNNGWSVMGQALPGAGTINFIVRSIGADNVSLAIDDAGAGNVFRAALTAFDLRYGSPDNRGVIDGQFLIPEPASLTLLAIGLAGLGFTRRQRKEAA